MGSESGRGKCHTTTKLCTPVHKLKTNWIDALSEQNYTQCLWVHVRTKKDTSLDILVMKGKASTAKQTCLGSLLELELNLYCVLILSFWRHSVNWTWNNTFVLATYLAQYREWNRKVQWWCNDCQGHTYKHKSVCHGQMSQVLQRTTLGIGCCWQSLGMCDLV